MLNKTELIKRLKADPMYKDALKMTQSDAERQRIVATCEGFLSRFMDSITPIAAHVKQDPSIAIKLKEAIEAGVVVKESDGKPVDDNKEG